MAMSQFQPPMPDRTGIVPTFGKSLSPVAKKVPTAQAIGTFFATGDKDFPKVGTVPLLSGIGGWNWLIAAVIGLVAMSIADRTRPPAAPGQRGWRYAGVAMSVSALLGLLWVVVFYVISNTSTHIPFYSDLGQWNIVIGMGFIIAAFGFATKWE